MLLTFPLRLDVVLLTRNFWCTVKKHTQPLLSHSVYFCFVLTCWRNLLENSPKVPHKKVKVGQRLNKNGKWKSQSSLILINPVTLSPCMCFSLHCQPELSMCRQELLTRLIRPQGVFLPDPALIIFHYTCSWDCYGNRFTLMESAQDLTDLFRPLLQDLIHATNTTLDFDEGRATAASSLISEGVNSAAGMQGLCFPKS